jgi:hypothetical protein
MMNESTDARLTGSEYLNDWSFKYSPRFSAYASIPWKQYGGLLFAIYLEAQADKH